MARLTVGLPVFNGMPYLPAAVESLLAQTFADFELLIVNDGSTDSSLQYLKTLADPRIRLVSQENRGLPATLNWMLKQSSTVWHVIHHADDLAYPTRLQLIADAINRHPDAGMFYSLADQIPAAPGRRPFRTTLGGPELLRLVTRAGYLLAICHPTVALNAEKTLGVGGYRTDLKTTEDIDLWWRLALRFDVRMIPETTVAYRLTPTGISNSAPFTQEVETIYVQYLLLSELWGREPQSFDTVRPVLETVVDLPQLRARQHLRRAAVEYSESRYLRALQNAAAALFDAPGYLGRRIIGKAHFRDRQVQMNGLDPLVFVQRSAELWPSS
jgi:hypothetical protein